MFVSPPLWQKTVAETPYFFIFLLYLFSTFITPLKWPPIVIYLIIGTLHLVYRRSLSFHRLENAKTKPPYPLRRSRGFLPLFSAIRAVRQTLRLGPPYTDRWEILKPAMCRLYIDEKKGLKEVVQIMEANYRFYASQNQYKRQFGLWNVSKALSSKKKEKISKALQTRAGQGKATTASFNGHDQSKAMRRYLKDQTRQDVARLPSFSLSIENLSGHALQCGNRLFMNWNTSAAVLAHFGSKPVNHFSPAFLMGTPMSGVELSTPTSNSVPSPTSAQPDIALANNTIKAFEHPNSSKTLMARENLLASRAHTFLTGDHMALLNGMPLPEQIVTTDWLNQFWQFSFRTARTWGRGPRTWNSENLGFKEIPEINVQSSSSTGPLTGDSPNESPGRQSSYKRYRTSVGINKPPSECRWCIHINPMAYESAASPPKAQDLPIALDNEKTWKEWPEEVSLQEFTKTLERNIESNSFSTINISEIPMAANQIARGLKRTPEQMLVEAFGFSIMARNVDLVTQMFDELDKNPELRLDGIFPLHLAASYIDGSKTCCQIFEVLISELSTGLNSVRKLYTNHLNHTVLDTLMISILKSHTSCVPDMVDDAFKNEHRFAGEEVDACGRWDADSDCIRQLQANGIPTIPRHWKHMFCHTSAQTMIHCITILFGPHWSPDINTPSGIFLKRCQNETCGLKMQLKPLHTLVVTAVHLAQYGSEGETLFGMIACLLCLLSKGANPLLKADISVRALVSEDYGQDCSHSELDPLELALLVPYDLVSRWPRDRKTGWYILCGVLENSQKEWKPHPEMTTVTRNNRDETLDDKDGRSSDTESLDYQEANGTGLPSYCPLLRHPTEGYHQPWHKNYFRENDFLSTLWAAVQTELLTYRRVSGEGPWVSENFSMESVLQSLETEDKLTIGLISKKLMKPFCRCGIFNATEDMICVHREEVCYRFFSNMEDWDRTTFIGDKRSGDHLDSWYKYDDYF